MNNVKKSVKAKGHYRVLVNGDVVMGKDNLIVNQGLQGSYSFFKMDSAVYCVLGTGSTPVELTDTALENKIVHAGVDSTETTYSIVDGVKYRTRVYTYGFAAGDFVGTLSEIGIVTANSTTAIISRVVLDTPLELSATDQITVVYEAVLEVPSFDDTTIINIFGSDVSCRLVSTNVEDRTKINATTFETDGSDTTIFLEDMTHILRDQAILNSEYLIDDTFLVNSLADNTDKDNVNGTITLTTDIANYDSGIFAVGFSRVSSKPEFMLIFDSPIMKTENDLINITIDIQLVMENV